MAGPQDSLTCKASIPYEDVPQIYNFSLTEVVEFVPGGLLSCFVTLGNLFNFSRLLFPHG